MKRFILFCLVALSAFYADAASGSGDLPDWQNPYVVERNRLPMTATFDAGGLKQTLNGVWKFQWYESIPARSLDFYSPSYDDRAWDEMPVPGMWELNGYGAPV